MTLLSAAKLGFRHAAQPERLFADVTFDIHPGDRIALVGPNGAGKTTLLRLVTGELAPQAGEIVRRRGLTLAHVPQESTAAPDEPLIAHVLAAAPAVAALRQDLLALEARLDDPAAALAYADRVAEYAERGGYETEARAAAVLTGLGLGGETHGLPMGALSSGQCARAELARVLVSPASLLLLDEPTNHLDLDAREWLEGYLDGLEAAVLLVSHDRVFLARAARRVFALENATVTVYEGDYDFYRGQRSLAQRQAWEAWEGQERRRKAAMRAYEERMALARRVDETPKGQNIRNGKDFYAAKAAKVAKTAKILRDRPLHVEPVEKPRLDEAIPVLSFPHVRRAGEIVLCGRGLAKRYGERTLFAALDLELARGERVALVGPNGAGKTTLLRVLMGLVAPDAGALTHGAHVRLGYYAQNLDQLDPERSALAHAQAYDHEPGHIRTILACLKLRGERVHQPVGRLSAGERGKVAIATLLFSGANVLLLDEPTNHLDLDAREALEGTLAQFPGTILFVSHDRRFVERLAQRAVELGVKKN